MNNTEILSYKCRLKKLIEYHTGEGLGYPFSAVILYRNKEFYAVNSVLRLKDPTSHAEIEAIRKCCQTFSTVDIAGAILISSAEPCPMCLSAIAWAGIKTVYYFDNYQIAKDKGYKIDQDANKVNKNLKLQIDLIQINE